MKQRWVYRGSILVAVSTLALIATGADLTGKYLDHVTTQRTLHTALSVIVSVLDLVLALLLALRGQKKLAYILAILVLAEGAAGTPSWIAETGPWLSILHACLAPVLFSAVAAAVVVTSPAWPLPPRPVADAGWPSLRSLAVLTPCLVTIQIALGAGFRHRVIGIMPHVAGAIIVALMLLLTGMFVTQQCPDHKALKPPAAALMAMAFTQVFLGIGALTMRMMNSTYTRGVAGVTVTHVVIGALTLGVNVVLALQIRRHVGA